MSGFSFYAPALIKSGSPKTGIKVGGIISAQTRDADGEVLLTKGLDLSFFDEGWGKIKYEHDSKISKEPDNIIGFPTNYTKKGTTVTFEGELIPFNPDLPDEKLTPQERSSKSAYGLLKAIEDWNRAHPDKQQKAGWSIEGEYIEKGSKGIIKKAKVTNVVLTTKPKNQSTVAGILKSLSVGYGTSPETQTGFGATRKESIDTSIKNHKGDSKMKYKSKQEYYKALIEEGKGEEEAKKLADGWKPEEEDKEKMMLPEEAMKSLSASRESFEKALNTVKEVEDVEFSYETEEVQKSLRKSVNTINNSEEVDLTDYFKAKQSADVNLLESNHVINQKIDLLAKSFGALAEGLLQVAGSNEFLAKSINAVNQISKLNAKATTQLIKSKAGESGLITDQFILNNADVVDNSTEEVKLNKSQTLNILDDLYAEGKIPSSTVIGYEGTGYLEEPVLKMVKSKAQTMSK